MAIIEEHYFNLSAGRCYVKEIGHKQGKPLLMIHGATVPSWVFERVTPHFVAAGYRCIQLDLFGHGQSDYPRGAYTLDWFSQQVLETLDHLEITDSLDLIGFSLGAAVGTRAVIKAPHRFRSALLVAPVVNYFQQKPHAHLYNTPILGRGFLQFGVIPGLMIRRWGKYRHLDCQEYFPRFTKQVLKPEFTRSLSQILKSDCLRCQLDHYKVLACLSKRYSLKTAVFYGTEDSVVTPQQIEQLKQSAPIFTYQALHNRDHSLLLTAPREISSRLIDHLALPTPTVPIETQRSQHAGF